MVHRNGTGNSSKTFLSISRHFKANYDAKPTAWNFTDSIYEHIHAVCALDRTCVSPAGDNAEPGPISNHIYYLGDDCSSNSGVMSIPVLRCERWGPQLLAPVLDV